MKDKKDLEFYMAVDLHKSVDDSEEWIFEGIASTDSMDLFGDVVYPESFAKSLEFFKANGKIFYNHNYAKKGMDIESQTPIGIPLEAKLTPDGLYIKGVLNKAHSLAKKVWHEFLTNPDKQFQKSLGLSIGAKAMGPTRREYSPAHGKVVNFLPELLLYEVSMTSTPVNPNTKTWASVMKSILEEDEVESKEQIFQLPVEEAVYDKERNQLFIKSSVQNEDGTTYVFEHYVNLEGDVKKAMDNLKDDKKELPFQKEGEEKKPETTDAPAEEGKSDVPEGLNGAPTEAPAEMPAEGEMPAAEGEGEAPTGEMPAVPGAEGEMPGGEPEAGLGELFGSEDNSTETADGTPEEDASQAMVLDKLDTITDVLTSLAKDMAANMNKDTLGVDTATQPPVNTDIMKSTEGNLDFAKLISENLGTIIKSVIEEAVKNAIESQFAVINQANMLKSVSTEPKTIVIRNPGLELATGVEVVHERVLKSIDGLELDTTVLKGFVTNYLEIKGNGPSISQKRADLAAQATKELNISQGEFQLLTRQFETKQLKL